MKLQARTVIGQLSLRWMALAIRDRRALSMLAGFLISTLAWFVIWQPLQNQKDEALSNYIVSRENDFWLRNNEHILEALLEKGDAVPPSASLLTIVGNEGATSQIAISHAELSADGRLSISIEDVSFRRLIKWLTLLRAKDHIVVSEISIEKLSAEGMVSGSFILNFR